jgi:hypothetical protein
MQNLHDVVCEEDQRSVRDCLMLHPSQGGVHEKQAYVHTLPHGECGGRCVKAVVSVHACLWYRAANCSCSEPSSLDKRTISRLKLLLRE